MQRLLMASIGSMLLVACVTSLEPVIPESETFEPGLVGTWVNGEARAVISETSEGYYVLFAEVLDDGTIIRKLLDGRLGYVGGRLALEVEDAPADPERWPLSRSTHALFFLELSQDSLAASELHPDSLRKAFSTGTLHLPHLVGEDEVPTILLTAASGPLRDALDEYVRRDGTLSPPQVWVRVTDEP